VKFEPGASSLAPLVRSRARTSSSTPASIGRRDPARAVPERDGDLEVAVGDQVEVRSTRRGRLGATRLSREKAKRNQSWLRLIRPSRPRSRDRPHTGKVKGGFTVEVDQIGVPARLAGRRPSRARHVYLENRTSSSRSQARTQAQTTWWSARRAVVEQEYSASARRCSRRAAGRACEVKGGRQENLTDYGAVRRLAASLLHITDMAWKRSSTRREWWRSADELMVKVLKVRRGSASAALARLKQLGDDPWVNAARRYPEAHAAVRPGHEHRRLGCFVEIEEGVEGLVHVSEMTGQQEHPPSKLGPARRRGRGSWCSTFDEERRASARHEAVPAEPVEEFAENHKKGDHVNRPDPSRSPTRPSSSAWTAPSTASSTCRT